jgi:hypothetical protein
MGGQIAHDFRDRPPGYIETPSSPEVLMGGKFDVRKTTHEMAEKYKAVEGRSLPKTTREYITGVIYFSRHQVEKVMATPGGLKAMNDRAVQWVKDWAEKLGSKVRYLVRHTDESVSHYQFALDNVVGGRTVMRHLTREDLSELQTSIAETYEGLGFERGRKGSRDQHKTIGQMHAAEYTEFLGVRREKENLKKEIYELKLAITESQEIVAELKQKAHQQRAKLKTEFMRDLREIEKLQREIEAMKKQRAEEEKDEAREKLAELIRAKENLLEREKENLKKRHEADKRAFKGRWDLER